MTWLEVWDAMNPANVPRPTPYREWRWMPYEPITSAQASYLNDLLRTTGLEAAQVFGDGFTAVDNLSQWAASWAIDNLRDVQVLADAQEQRMKRQMASVVRERMLPVRFCASCDGDRPHRIVSAVLVCEVCKEITS